MTRGPMFDIFHTVSAYLESFLDATLNVDVNFRVKFHDQIVVVPEGGGVRGIEVKVVAK